MPRRDERRKHVVDVVVALVAGRLLDDVRPPSVADARGPARRCARNAARSRARRRVAADGDRARRSPARARAYSAAPRARGRPARRSVAVEQHRRRLEEVEDEHEHAARQDQQLQRDLHERAHQQRVPRLVHRLRRQVALHLALIAAEIRQHQEQPADHARPERVGLAQVEREVDRLQPAGGAGQVQRLAEADVAAGCPTIRIADGRRHAADDDDHLLDVGPGHRLHAADRRVDDHRHADGEDGHRQRPAENGRHHDGGRRQRHAERQPRGRSGTASWRAMRVRTSKRRSRYWYAV